MLFKNTVGQGVYIYAHDTITDTAKTGDHVNITAIISKDGGAGNATATLHPTSVGGGIYWFPLSQAETNADAIAIYAASSTSGVQIDPVIILTQAGAIPKVAAGAAGGLATSTGVPIPSVPVYALDAPSGIVITGPAWAGDFDVVGVRAGRPLYQRRGQYAGTDYYMTWDGTDTWNVGTTLGGVETGYTRTDPSPVGQWVPPSDITVGTVGVVTLTENTGGSFQAGDQCAVRIWSCKTVHGVTAYGEVSEVYNSATLSAGASVDITWDAVSGATGYLLQVFGPAGYQHYFTVTGLSQNVTRAEEWSDGWPTVFTPYTFPALSTAGKTMPADTRAINGIDADDAIQTAAAAAITTADLATATQVNSITTNTARGRPVVPDQFCRPRQGDSPILYEVDLNVYTLQGGFETPTEPPTIHARNPAGTSRDALLGSTTMLLISAGRYRMTMTVASDTAAEQVLFDFSWAVGGVSFGASDSVWITDAYAVDFTSADRTRLEAIHTALPADAARIGTSNYAGGAATPSDVAAAITSASPATHADALAVLASADAAARPGDAMEVADKTGFSLADDGLPTPTPAGYGGASAEDVWACPERTLTGGPSLIPPTAYTNDQDIHYTVYKNGTRPLCARVRLASGDDVTPSDIASAVYSIFLLDDEDADARLAVSGHAAVALLPSDILPGALQTDQLAADYNFRHVPDIASHAAFAVAGRRYLVEYRLTPIAGQAILVRFRINVI